MQLSHSGCDIRVLRFCHCIQSQEFEALEALLQLHSIYHKEYVPHLSQQMRATSSLEIRPKTRLTSRSRNRRCDYCSSDRSMHGGHWFSLYTRTNMDISSRPLVRGGRVSLKTFLYTSSPMNQFSMLGGTLDRLMTLLYPGRGSSSSPTPIMPK